MDFELDRARTAGEILSDGLGLFFKRFWLLAGLALIVTAPIELAVALWKPEAIDPSMIQSLEPSAFLEPLTAYLLIYQLIAIPLTGAVVMSAVDEVGHGGQAQLVRVLGRALPVFLTAIGTTFVATLATAGGLILLIVPGVWLGTLLVFSTQAAVIERTGVIEAVRRSVGLVRGRFWATFRAAFLITAGAVAVALVPYFAVSAITITPLYIAATVLLDAITSAAIWVIWALFFYSWRASQARPAETI